MSRVTVPVSLGERSYDILVGGGALDELPGRFEALGLRPRTAIITDEHVAAHHLEHMQSLLKASGIKAEAIILPAGEATKSFTMLEAVLSRLLDLQIERNDAVIALGGGVIGDLTGLAAALLRRGTKFIQVPTTLLAQVDSSVGGKTAINVKQGKNLIGAFYQPQMVIADTALLATLPKRERLAGYAEVVKYGLIADAPFFVWLEDNGAKVLSGDDEALTQAVKTSCEAKAAIVAEDERESGKRALLNFGHTFGHALEAATGYSGRLLHGEGIAIGMGLAFELSAALGHCSPQEAARLRAHLRQVGAPTRISDIQGYTPDAEALLAHMYQDKKVSGGELTFVLARHIGEAFVAKGIAPQAVLDVLNAHIAATPET